MKNQKINYIARAALVAALYVALTHLSNVLGLASGAIQIRFSEALCILPFFMPSAIPGLFVGCIIANLTTGAVVWDILFGSLATLIGAFFASKLKNKYLIPIPTVIANTIIVPIIVLFCYTDKSLWTVPTYLIGVAGVFAGEIISAYIFGIILFSALNKHKNIFK
ncbi:MAG: QueT transporter family protein [Clostridia bacterium]|nr:QueT transporter family protein [Clostridia bacterium]